MCKRKEKELAWCHYIILLFEQGQTSSAFHKNLSSGSKFSIASVLMRDNVAYDTKPFHDTKDEIIYVS